MVQIVIVEKNGSLKEVSIKECNETQLCKKAGFKTMNHFEKQGTWGVKDGQTEYVISLYGKKSGRAGQENKYDFPPPMDNDLFFGNCTLVCYKKDNTADLILQDLNTKLWKTCYETLFGGFEDIGSEDSEEDEDDEDKDLPQTKEGYAKDGFVVEDEEDEEDDEDDEEDEDEDEDVEDEDLVEEGDLLDDEEEDEDEDEEEEDEDEDDEEEIVPKRRHQPKRKSREKNTNKLQTIFSIEKQEEEYMNCESELSEEEYV